MSSYGPSQRSGRRDMIRPDAGSLAQLSKGLQQARSELADRMAAQLITEPERVIPDAGLMWMLAPVQGTIAAIEAVLTEDQGGGI